VVQAWGFKLLKLRIDASARAGRSDDRQRAWITAHSSKAEGSKRSLVIVINTNAAFAKGEPGTPSCRHPPCSSHLRISEYQRMRNCQRARTCAQHMASCDLHGISLLFTHSHRSIAGVRILIKSNRRARNFNRIHFHLDLHSLRYLFAFSSK
jgi:hypothetical protein